MSRLASLADYVPPSRLKAIVQLPQPERLFPIVPRKVLPQNIFPNPGLCPREPKINRNTFQDVSSMSNACINHEIPNSNENRSQSRQLDDEQSEIKSSLLSTSTVQANELPPLETTVHPVLLRLPFWEPDANAKDESFYIPNSTLTTNGSVYKRVIQEQLKLHSENRPQSYQDSELNHPESLSDEPVATIADIPKDIDNSRDHIAKSIASDILKFRNSPETQTWEETTDIGVDLINRMGELHPSYTFFRLSALFVRAAAYLDRIDLIYKLFLIAAKQRWFTRFKRRGLVHETAKELASNHKLFSRFEDVLKLHDKTGVQSKHFLYRLLTREMVETGSHDLKAIFSVLNHAKPIYFPLPPVTILNLVLEYALLNNLETIRGGKMINWIAKKYHFEVNPPHTSDSKLVERSKSRPSHKANTAKILLTYVKSIDDLFLTCEYIQTWGVLSHPSVQSVLFQTARNVWNAHRLETHEMLGTKNHPGSESLQTYPNASLTSLMFDIISIFERRSILIKEDAVNIIMRALLKDHAWSDIIRFHEAYIKPFDFRLHRPTRRELIRHIKNGILSSTETCRDREHFLFFVQDELGVSLGEVLAKLPMESCSFWMSHLARISQDPLRRGVFNPALTSFSRTGRISTGGDWTNPDGMNVSANSRRIPVMKIVHF